MLFRLTFAVFALIAGSFTMPAFACGKDSRCEVRDGYYLASAPADWDGETPLPVVVYFHGWGGTPEGTFRNKAMVNGVNRRGALFVVPFARSGYWRQIGEGRAERGRDELKYIRRVMADLKRRWPINESRVMSSGFSRGASMSWNVACYAGDLFTAHAPIAGGFWRSTPRTWLMTRLAFITPCRSRRACPCCAVLTRRMTNPITNTQRGVCPASDGMGKLANQLKSVCIRAGIQFRLNGSRQDMIGCCLSKSEINRAC